MLFHHEPGELVRLKQYDSNQQLEEDLNPRAESRQIGQMGLESKSSVRLTVNVVHLFNDYALEFRVYRSGATLEI
jgi:hypothetical protein